MWMAHPNQAHRPQEKNPSPRQGRIGAYQLPAGPPCQGEVGFWLGSGRAHNAVSIVAPNLRFSMAFGILAIAERIYREAVRPI